MKIRINRQEVEIEPGSTIAQVLDARGIPLEHTAVELNGEILDRERFDRVIHERDEVVVVRFVGGG